MHVMIERVAHETRFRDDSRGTRRLSQACCNILDPPLLSPWQENRLLYLRPTALLEHIYSNNDYCTCTSVKCGGALAPPSERLFAHPKRCHVS